MKDYQRRTFLKETEGKIKYKTYTKDSFFYNSDKKLWGWKQESKGIIHYARNIEELKKIKKKEFIGKGNYDHSVTHAWQNSEYMGTDEFANKCGIKNREGKPCTKNYISLLLKRGVSPLNEYDESLRGAGIHKATTRKKSGQKFLNCLKKSNIEYKNVFPNEIYKSKFSKNNYIMKQKIWVFKNATENNLRIFKKLWYEKN